MAINNVNVGTAPDNGTGDSLRIGGQKINANFAFLDGKIDGLTKVSFVSSLPGTGDSNVLYARTTDKTLHRWNGTGYDPYGGSGGGATWGSITGTLSDQTDLQTALDAKEKKRIRDVKTNTTQYTVVASDFTDKELFFNADTAGAEIDVIINTGVCPDTSPSTGLQIISAGNHVLNFTGTATLTPTAGSILKSANDGTSQAIIGVKPGSTVDSLGVFGSLQGDATGGGGTTYDVFTDSEDGLTPAVLNEPSATVSNITSTGFDATVSSGGSVKVLKSTGWQEETAYKRIEKIVNTYPYTFELGDENKLIVLEGSSTDPQLIIPDNIFSEGDEFKIISNMSGSSDRAYFPLPSGGFSTLILASEGSFHEIKKSGTVSVNFIDPATVWATGDFIKEYEIFESPDGTLYKVGVDDTGARTSTAL